MCAAVRGCTCVHRPLCVQAVSAALIGLSTQSDSDWLLGQTTRTDGSAVKSQTAQVKLQQCHMEEVKDRQVQVTQTDLTSHFHHHFFLNHFHNV